MDPAQPAGGGGRHPRAAGRSAHLPAPRARPAVRRGARRGLPRERPGDGRLLPPAHRRRLHRRQRGARLPWRQPGRTARRPLDLRRAVRRARTRRAAGAAPPAAGPDLALGHGHRVRPGPAALHERDALVAIVRPRHPARRPPLPGSAAARPRHEALQRQRAGRAPGPVGVRPRRGAAPVHPGEAAAARRRAGDRRGGRIRRPRDGDPRTARRGARLRRLPARPRACPPALPARADRRRALVGRAGVEHRRRAAARRGSGRRSRHPAAGCRRVGAGVAGAARRRQRRPLPAPDRTRQAGADRRHARRPALRRRGRFVLRLHAGAVRRHARRRAGRGLAGLRPPLHPPLRPRPRAAGAAAAGAVAAIRLPEARRQPAHAGTRLRHRRRRAGRHRRRLQPRRARRPRPRLRPRRHPLRARRRRPGAVTQPLRRADRARPVLRGARGAGQPGHLSVHRRRRPRARRRRPAHRRPLRLRRRHVQRDGRPLPERRHHARLRR